MSNSVSVNVSFTPLYKNLVEKFEKAIVDEAFIKADHILSPIAQREFISRLPDGTESRKKQAGPNSPSRMSARFPNHMKQNVRIKRLKDSRGVASIIGTTTAVGQTHFDFGDKAKTTGRVHKLWPRKGQPIKYARPPNRVQRKELQDLPEQVGNHISGMLEEVVLREIVAAIGRIS